MRAAREMKKSGWANWGGAREDSGIKGGPRRLKQTADPFDDCDGVALDAVPAPEPVLGTAAPLRESAFPPPLPLLILDSQAGVRERVGDARAYRL